MSKIGSRVGAILGADNSIVEFLGYGVYEGDFIPVESVGFMADTMRKNGLTNPRIKLDSGKIVYGCECWWGDETAVQKRLAGYEKVVNVDIDNVRADWLADSKR